MRIRPLLAVLGTALVGALGVTSAASAAPAGPQPIIGGGTVSSAPWAAAVLSNGSFTCSGSVIAAQWVLTARHCISGTMSVRVGSVNRTSGGVTRTVSATYTRYDLALMRLSSTVSTSTVSLASSNPPINSTNSIYGWGMTCYSGCSRVHPAEDRHRPGDQQQRHRRVRRPGDPQHPDQRQRLAR